MSILKVDITIVPLFFLIYYALVPKLEICLKYFLDKFPKAAIMTSFKSYALPQIERY